MGLKDAELRPGAKSGDTIACPVRKCRGQSRLFRVGTAYRVPAFRRESVAKYAFFASR